MTHAPNEPRVKETNRPPGKRRAFMARGAALAFLSITCLVTLSACVVETGVQPGPPPAPDLTGTWTGSWASDDVGEGDLSAVLRQTGDQLEGTISLTNADCLDSGDLTGTFDGSEVNLEATNGEDTVDYTATGVNDAVIDGTYEVTTGLCAGDTGTFILEADD